MIEKHFRARPKPVWAILQMIWNGSVEGTWAGNVAFGEGRWARRKGSTWIKRVAARVNSFGNNSNAESSASTGRVGHENS
ncbi:unnamed protein product [Linum trigynum]|uniref:Uncharacterized protein n=1 Tax=Linum trigynum TaxID=586398 RepID=A0AAV2FXF5_9ROSI